MKNYLATYFTGPDGLAHLLWAQGVVVFMGLAIYSVYASDGHHFDAQAFGIGFGAVLAGGGVGVGVNSKMRNNVNGA